VHVARDRNLAKFWLDPVKLESVGRFPAHEIQEIEQWVKVNHRKATGRRGMNTSARNLVARAREVSVRDDELIVHLVDGRRIAVPIKWFPKLFNATCVEGDARVFS
jgi:hypothetical protein